MLLTDSIERHAGRALFVIPAGFAVCLLFELFGPYLNYAIAGYIDPWIYTGYFTNFSNIQRFHGFRYYFSRLPWTIPGLLMFQVATPAAASILLNACLLATSVIALYLAVRWHYGTAPALLASVALATSPSLHSAIGWDYPDGPAIAYGFVAAAFALRPHGRRAVNTILMAVFLALSGFTNMSGAPMILGVLAFPLWRQRRSAAELVKEAGYIVTGVAAAILALLPVSKWMLGYWWFFMEQIKLAQLEMGNGALTRMWGSGNDFLATAYRLFPPMFLLVFGPALLFLSRKRKDAAWAAYLSLAICFLLYCYQEFVLHGVALRVPYHSVYLVVPVFLFAGMVLGELWQRAAWTREWIVTGAVALFVVALPFVVDSSQHDLFVSITWGNMAVAGAVGLLLLAAWKQAPTVFRIPLVLLLATLLYAGPARQLNPFRSTQPHNREDFDALMNTQTILLSAKPPERDTIFWVDRDEVHDSLFVSAQALWTSGAFDFTKYLTTSSAEDLRVRFQSNPTLVHLTDHPEKIAERLKLLDSRGVHYENHRQWIVRAGASQFYVAAEDMTDIWGIH